MKIYGKIEFIKSKSIENYYHVAYNVKWGDKLDDSGVGTYYSKEPDFLFSILKKSLALAIYNRVNNKESYAGLMTDIEFNRPKCIDTSIAGYVAMLTSYKITQVRQGPGNHYTDDELFEDFKKSAESGQKGQVYEVELNDTHDQNLCIPHVQSEADFYIKNILEDYRKLFYPDSEIDLVVKNKVS